MSKQKVVHSDILNTNQRQALLQIAKRYGASRVRIFGSRSRGEAGPNSDLDLLVAMEQGRSLLDLIGFRNEAEDSLGIKVDVVTEAGLSPYLKDQILAEAIDL